MASSNNKAFRFAGSSTKEVKVVVKIFYKHWLLKRWRSDENHGPLQFLGLPAFYSADSRNEEVIKVEQ